MMTAATKTTEGCLSHGEFAALAARIAGVAAHWSADALLPMKEYDKPIDPGTVERFVEEILSRAYRLRERAYANR